MEQASTIVDILYINLNSYQNKTALKRLILFNKSEIENPNSEIKLYPAF